MVKTQSNSPSEEDASFYSISSERDEENVIIDTLTTVLSKFIVFLLKTSTLIFVCCFVFLSSLSVYLYFYNRIIPKVEYDVPIYLSYINKEKNFNSIYDTELWCTANLTSHNPSWKNYISSNTNTNKTYLTSNYVYSFTVLFNIPEDSISEYYNNFMGNMELYSHSTKIGQCSRTLFLKPKSFYQQYIHPLLFWWIDIFKTHTIRTLAFTCFDGYYENPHFPLTSIALEISDPSLVIENASLHIQTQLNFIKRILYHFKWIIGIGFSNSVMYAFVFLILFVYCILYMIHTSKSDTNKMLQNNSILVHESSSYSSSSSSSSSSSESESSSSESESELLNNKTKSNKEEKHLKHNNNNNNKTENKLKLSFDHLLNPSKSCISTELTKTSTSSITKEIRNEEPHVLPQINVEEQFQQLGLNIDSHTSLTNMNKDPSSVSNNASSSGHIIYDYDDKDDTDLADTESITSIEKEDLHFDFPSSEKLHIEKNEEDPLRINPIDSEKLQNYNDYITILAPSNNQNQSDIKKTHENTQTSSTNNNNNNLEKHNEIINTINSFSPIEPTTNSNTHQPQITEITSEPTKNTLLRSRAKRIIH